MKIQYWIYLVLYLGFYTKGYWQELFFVHLVLFVVQFSRTDSLPLLATAWLLYHPTHHLSRPFSQFSWKIFRGAWSRLIFTAHRGIIIIILYECADARVHNLPRTGIVYSEKDRFVFFFTNESDTGNVPGKATIWRFLWFAEAPARAQTHA